MTSSDQQAGTQPSDAQNWAAMLGRAQGCLLGQLAGDSLGSLVEFMKPEQIRRSYPDGVRELADGGAWDTIAGQPTDDSEMALSLARTLVERGCYDVELARAAYKRWLDSDPFDVGRTVYAGLRGQPRLDSQANGALMRISPLGIFGATRDLVEVRRWAEQDAEITHPHPVCRQANGLFARAIALAIRTGCSAAALYQHVLVWAEEADVEASLRETVRAAAEGPPEDYLRYRGWVLVALRNALYQLLNAPNLEEGVVDTVMRGGDTDTNAAICGALLGAVHGRSAIPRQWLETLLACRPAAGRPGVHHPRPECYWPDDALELAERLLSRGESGS